MVGELIEKIESGGRMKRLTCIGFLLMNMGIVVATMDIQEMGYDADYPKDLTEQGYDIFADQENIAPRAEIKDRALRFVKKHKGKIVGVSAAVLTAVLAAYYMKENGGQPGPQQGGTSGEVVIGQGDESLAKQGNAAHFLALDSEGAQMTVLSNLVEPKKETVKNLIQGLAKSDSLVLKDSSQGILKSPLQVLPGRLFSQAVIAKLFQFVSEDTLAENVVQEPAATIFLAMPREHQNYILQKVYKKPSKSRDLTPFNQLARQLIIKIPENNFAKVTTPEPDVIWRIFRYLKAGQSTQEMSFKNNVMAPLTQEALWKQYEAKYKNDHSGDLKAIYNAVHPESGASKIASLKNMSLIPHKKSDVVQNPQNMSPSHSASNTHEVSTSNTQSSESQSTVNENEEEQTPKELAEAFLQNANSKAQLKKLAEYAPDVLKILLEGLTLEQMRGKIKTHLFTEAACALFEKIADAQVKDGNSIDIDLQKYSVIVFCSLSTNDPTCWLEKNVQINVLNKVYESSWNDSKKTIEHKKKRFEKLVNGFIQNKRLYNTLKPGDVGSKIMHILNSYNLTDLKKSLMTQKVSN